LRASTGVVKRGVVKSVGKYSEKSGEFWGTTGRGPRAA
jgi:hypothetical protein